MNPKLFLLIYAHVPVLGRTGLIFAVGRRRHAQHLEVIVIAPGHCWGVEGVWQHSGSAGSV